jgi:hypothetical protein
MGWRDLTRHEDFGDSAPRERAGNADYWAFRCGMAEMLCLQLIQELESIQEPTTQGSGTMSLTLKDSDSPVDLAASFLDAAGNPAGGTVTFTVTGTAALTDNGDGTAKLGPGTGLGDSSVTATNTPADGTPPVVTPPFGVTVVAGDAVSGSISVVTPAPAPAPAPAPGP